MRQYILPIAIFLFISFGQLVYCQNYGKVDSLKVNKVHHLFNDIELKAFLTFSDMLADESLCRKRCFFTTEVRNQVLEVRSYYHYSDLSFFLVCHHEEDFLLEKLPSDLDSIALSMFRHVQYDTINDTAKVHFSRKAIAVNFKNEQINNDDSVVVYPNPAKDIITIKVPGDAQVQNLILFDIAGRPVLKRETFNTENPLELPGLAEGVYILRFEKDGVVFRERILVRP